MNNGKGTILIRDKSGKVMENRNAYWNAGTHNTALNGVKLFVGHDEANIKFSGSYRNNCLVKYVKYFPNAVCTVDESAKLQDCSADKC